MKHQQVKIDYTTMVKTSVTYLALAGAMWVLFKLVQAVFLFPRYLERNHERLLKSFEGKYDQDATLEETLDLVEKTLEDSEHVQEQKKNK